LLPNLDDVRRRPPAGPQTPPPVTSTMRSRHKPMESRHGMRVGDPLPPVRRAAWQGSGGGQSSAAGFGSSGADNAAEDYGLYSTRFLVSPSYEQIQSLAGSFAFPGPSFDYFDPPMPQAGGSKVVFSSNRDGQTQLYLMNPDGSGQVRLTSSGGNDDSPRWSPNGTRILFQSDRDNPSTGYNDIYVMNSDGTGQTRLTTDPDDDSSASWSPDGSRIVFQSLRNGQLYQVYVMNADGTGQLNLSNSLGSDGQPSWSPDGTRIAFASERDHEGFASVYVMNANGTGQRRLTFSADYVTDEQPVWSRDGSKIAFVSTRDGDKEIYVMNADGTGQTRLTAAAGNDDSPSWSPDGTKIVFRSDRERDWSDPTSQVWVMNADGTGLVNLSANEVGDYGASWTSGGGNQLPVASAGGSYSGITGQNTAFNGGSSFDPDGQITSYSWSFGDGGTASGVTPTHAYASPGAYAVTLTVTDNLGAQGSATATVSVSSSSSDQYVSNFLLKGLARQPSGQEGGYWADILRSAYPQGQTSVLLAMREFGMTVFESAEYASRGRTDHEYVSDLYETYLMRDPDPSGWAFWESQVPQWGREQVRHAFDECDEFHNIIATLTASGAPSPAASSLATARVDPFNQTGDQIQARDCEWGLTLLSLPGRAGLDLGLSLSYSSLAWTRSGPYAYFDEDRGTPGPGFRLSFATIQGPFFDAQAGRNVYVLITSSGRRTELRQVGTSSTYESGDSSYLQLTAGSTSLLLRTSDGTQMSFAQFLNGWQATAVEDRNGNFIGVGYSIHGDITSVTDTLGRALTFDYDANANLQTITQVWRVNGTSQTHAWASFGWGTKALQPGFSSVAAVGTFGGEVVPVLTQVGLDDGTRYNFEYTSSGQVNVIRRYSPDNVERSRATYTYATLADDCPRVIDMRVWADNWTGINGVPSEVVTQLTDNGDGSRAMTAPDGTVYKESYGTGWQKGLVIQEEVESGGAEQRLAVTTWDQDNTSVNYQTNPRVKETNVYDFPADAPSNRRRTTVDYGPYAQYGLPNVVTEYDSDGSRELRRTYTDYDLSQGYLDRHLIGLVSATHVYDPVAGQFLAKTTYSYDEAGSVGPQATTATGHDQSYGSTFLARGNLTSVSRYDVTDINNTAKAHTARMSYDAAGSILSSTDPAGHQNSIGYADSFSDGNNSRNTFAYPTTVTDAGGFSTTFQYDYDFGARTRAEGPPPAEQTGGLVQTFSYDGAARLQQVTTTNNGAYTRYAYGPYYVEQFASVNNAADEAYANEVFDGAGHVIGAASNHPGSTGGYKAHVAQYDATGRAVKRSNPAEIDGAWNPTGDDSAGWLYTQQTYDWKGRPRVTTNTDGTQRGASYQGCGCAGGEVVTLTDEMGRQRKVYSDPLGRQWKTEVLNWDGTVYSTAESILNVLDQATFVRRYQGNDQSGVFQETANSYDGYGRLQKSRAPAQTADTVFTYNADDTPNTVTDARGAAATYSYDNNRRLVTQITYTLAGSNTVTHTYAYDAAGNRTSATDGPGSGVTYQYDSLSRVTSEKRTFGGLSNPSSPYTLTYTYNLAGQLKTLTDPFGSQFTYTRDSVGRLTDVTGTAFAGVTTYVSGARYRAWGGVKSATFDGDSTSQTTGYDARMRPSNYQLTFGGGFSNLQREDFSYYGDGRLQAITDLDDGPGSSPPSTVHYMSRSYAYDHVGRVTHAGGTNTAPYQQDYAYDEFDDLTSRSGTYGWSGQWLGDSAAYTNGRRQGWTYDPDGRLSYSPANSSGPARWWGYDSAGHETGVAEAAAGGGYNNFATSYDCDGRTIYEASWGATVAASSYYLVRSSVLGGEVVTRLDSSGSKAYTYVPAEGLMQARQGVSSGQQFMGWTHLDPAGVSEQGSGLAAYDALGNYVQYSPPQGPPPRVQAPTYFGAWSSFTNAYNYSTGCTWDGAPADCGSVMRAIHDEQVKSVTLSTTGTKADFFNAGVGGLVSGKTVPGYKNKYSGDVILTPGKLPQSQDDGTYIYGDSTGWVQATFTVPGSQLDDGQNGTAGPQTPFGGITAGVSAQASSSDPCAGRKGKLIYSDKVRKHIVDRHIRTDINPKASKYNRGLPGIVEDQYDPFEAVKAFNNVTYRNATGFESRGNIVYVYAYPVVEYNVLGFSGKTSIGVGRDASHNNDVTNVNTLIVKSDCMTVVTSHPGLPVGLPANGPVTGTPEWFPGYLNPH
jgi:YD repeat-containing protein